LPQVLEATHGHDFTDYGYHIAVMTSQQVDEVDWLVREMGVGSFKYYMFYKGLNLAASSTDAAAYTMSDVYDLGHLYRFMQAVSAASQRYGSAAGRISLSIHCEQPEIIRTMIDEVKAQGLEGLEAIEELDAYVAEWIGARTQDEVVRAFEEAEAAVAPIYDAADIVKDPQYAALESIITVPDEELGPIKMQNVLFRMMGTPGRVRWSGRRIGQDTDTILTELGISPERIADLRMRGIV
jgi:crotonobetainyl-CoA:carnitine CoA-transferase CaiB-like acyl-CoA transferase